MTGDNALRISSTMGTPELIAFAEDLAATARKETLPRWASGVAVENKSRSGFDPVTEADREAERVMRDLIRQHFPDHGITGEEWPDELHGGRLRWSLDPVDGTRSFICGLPTWVTLIALLRDERPWLGLVDAPCLGETYFGSGNEAWITRNGERRSISTSACTSLSDARFSTTDPAMFEDSRSAFDALRRDVKTIRYGHDGYAYARLADGSIDLVIENGLKPYDYNALIPLISAAGGVIADWRGGQDYGGGKVIAAATRELYDEAVERFEAFA